MPPTNRPARFHLADTIHGHGNDIQSASTQQYHVVAIPLVNGVPVMSGGDPVHGYATFVTGWLGTVCGISAYGAASYRTGAWVQL